ncbi:MAG: hypothetical protein AAF958_17260, partial [Planctomycetota bacterium]
MAATLISLATLTSTALTNHAIAQAPAVPAGGVKQGLFQHAGKAYRIVSTAEHSAAPETSRGGQIQQVGMIGKLLKQGGCDTGCDVGACDLGGCSMDGGCDAGGFTMGACGIGGACGGNCGASSGYGCNQCSNGKSFCGLGYGYYNGPLCDPCYNPCNLFNDP